MATSATKYYKISYGIVEDDGEDMSPDWICQIMYEVLDVVAPDTMSRMFAVYKVPMNDEMFDTYEVFALIKCFNESPDRNIVREIREELAESLKQSDLLTFLGNETISEISVDEFTELATEHCYHQAS